MATIIPELTFMLADDKKSSDAKKLLYVNKRIDIANINKVLEEKMQRLDMAKKKYNATKERLSKEKDL